MNIVLFEDAGFANLLPLTYWRSAVELRCGAGSLLDHARARYPDASFALRVRPELRDVAAERTGLPVNAPPRGDDDVFLVNGRLLLRDRVPDGPCPGACRSGETLLWARLRGPQAAALTAEVLLSASATREALADVPTIPPPAPDAGLPIIDYPWDLVRHNPEMLVHAWRRLGPLGIQGYVYDGAHILDLRNVCVGPGSRIKPGAVLDAEDGPIIIEDNVTVQPNATIQGPAYIGSGSLIQTGVAVRASTSIGRVCKIGGEVEGSIIHAYSNKQHDGFLGHAYVGEFVNLAADTVNSDLKNTYGPVRVPVNGVEVNSGQIFVGLTIGDHAKTGIGQLFPTGAVVGFGSSVATAAFAPKYVPSFRWLTEKEDVPYDVERCLNVAKVAMGRRKLAPTAAEEVLFRSLPTIARQFER